MPLEETELYEMAVPGKFIGKEIIDADARRIGLCHSIKIKCGTDKKNDIKTELFLVIKGLDIEFDVPFNEIEKIGNVIKLKIAAQQADELQVKDAMRLQEDIAGEIRARATRI
jgi:sporulation protein YlmC with PRC-barrel domain